MATASRKSNLDKLSELVTGLSEAECALLDQLLVLRKGTIASQGLIAKRSTKIRHCPHCQSDAFTKHGKYKGGQRFRCHKCGATFSSVTGSPLCGLRHKEKHLENVVCMIGALSVRDVARRLGVNKNTAFLWRHRFLQRLIGLNPDKLGGALTVEVDETFIPRSFKGQKTPLPRAPRSHGETVKKPGTSSEQVPVLVARERVTAATFTQILPRTNTVTIDAILGPLLLPGTVLCSDGAAMYKKIAEKRGVTHYGIPFKAHSVTVDLPGKGETVYHIQNANAYISDLKRWMRPFCGPATKHLPAYLAWHRYVHAPKKPPSAGTFLSAAAS